MGSYASGVLAYGYDLGGPESGWNFSDLDYGHWLPPGVDEEEDDFEFSEWAEAKLLASVGFVDDDADDASDRKKAAQAHIGVEIVHSGNYDYFRAYLVTWHESGYGGDPEVIDIPGLERRRVEEDWDGRLANAAKVLELPKIMVPAEHYGEELTVEQRPHWILSAFYG